MYHKILNVVTVFVLVVGLFASFGTASATGTPPAGLTFNQNVSYQSMRMYDWSLTKTATPTSLILSPGQTAMVEYQVTGTATGSVINTEVKAEIIIGNGTGAPVTIEGISVVVPNASGAVKTCALPTTVAAGSTLNCMIYVPVSSDANTTFQATIYYDGASVTLPVQNVVFGTPIEVKYNCAEITDGSVTEYFCVDKALASFTKTVTIPAQVGPYAACGEYQVSNTASLTYFLYDKFAPKSPLFASAVVDVSVPCASGCSLTPGYWKTHSSYGPSKYDETWAMVGEDTPFFSSGQTWYSALWTNPAGDPYYILAHAYIAAYLNGLNGADTSAISAQMTHAAYLLATYTTVTKDLKADFVDTAYILDQYNNGLIGPGHCGE